MTPQSLMTGPEWIEAAAAVPVTALDYAVWVTAWHRQGGRIVTVYDQPFTPNGTWWAPTRPFPAIPPRYGDQAWNLLIYPGNGGDLTATSGDKRPGWEYGHTTLLTLNSQGHAWTNHPESVHAWADTRPGRPRRIAALTKENR